MLNGASGSSFTTSGGIEPSTSSNQKESLKTQFITREGLYKQMTISDQLSRPHRLTSTQAGGPNNSNYNAPVRVTFAKIPSTSGDTSSTHLDENGEIQPNVIERICFNIGRELFVYDFNGAKGSFDWTKPVDKRIYKGTFPTCHDFNTVTMTPQSCMLLVGFSAGQIQLIDPFQKEFQNSRLFNEDRLVDKSPVTCLKWIPNQAQLFIASHSSGNLYIYNEEFSCAPNPPTYSVLKQARGESFTISNVKSRSQQKNPIQKWSIGKGGINQFEFGGANMEFLATVSQDGFLRIFKYSTMELYSVMRSYFGGLLCLAWSPDHKLIATGGEDDLLTVYSVQEKRVICRGSGHRSFVTQVAFDPYTSGNPVVLSNSKTYSSAMNVGSISSSEELRPMGNGPTASNTLRYTNGVTENRPTFNGKPGSLADRWQSSIFDDSRSRLNSFEQNSIVYRIGTVSADTQLCLWDVEILGLATANGVAGASTSSTSQNHNATSVNENNLIPETTTATKDGTVKESKTSKLRKLHKRGLSFGNRHGNQDRWSRANIPLNRSAQNQANNSSNTEDGNPDRAVNLFGTAVCPKMDQISLIEPLVCKKISHERLTVLCFREECLVTGCQEGYISTWGRPSNRMSRL